MTSPVFATAALARPAAPVKLDPRLQLPLALGARLANILYTTQVQLAYACAMDAKRNAERSYAQVQAAPVTPALRELLGNVYAAQARSAAQLAEQVLAGARRRCGLAYAAAPGRLR